MNSVPLGVWLRKHSVRYLILRSVEIIRMASVTALSTAVFRLKCLVLRIPCGRNLEVYGRVLLISLPGRIEVGHRVQFISSSWRCTAAALSHGVRLRTFTSTAKIVLEDGCMLNGTSIAVRSKVVRIGRNSMLGPNVLVFDSDFHDPSPLQARKTNPGYEYDADVTIGENVWIGARSIILKGVSIGDNAVVAAGSVVVSSVPDNALAAGNPARVVKTYAVDADRA